MFFIGVVLKFPPPIKESSKYINGEENKADVDMWSEANKDLSILLNFLENSMQQRKWQRKLNHYR